MNTTSSQYSARYWKKLDADRIVCFLCPHLCHLKDGQRGFCFVRQNIHGQLILTVYGQSTGFCVDPIEKKPLYHFYPGSKILSFGTIGCNLACQFCQNWDISCSKEAGRMIERATPEQIAKAAKKSGCKSVAFTYNEPTIFAEFAMDVADACHKEGIQTVAVTSGYISNEARGDFYSKIDAANVDLKAFSDGFYKKICKGTLQPVLDTLIFLRTKTKVWFEITNLLIPGENDSQSEITLMCDWIVKNLGIDVPLHFSAFHPDYKFLEHAPTPGKILMQARDIACEKKIRYVYLGNVATTKEGNTYCHQCHKLLIERSGYAIGQYHVKDGQCAFCKTPCAGRFTNDK